MIWELNIKKSLQSSGMAMKLIDTWSKEESLKQKNVILPYEPFEGTELREEVVLHEI